jgi:fatty acyl-CoA reductase
MTASHTVLITGATGFLGKVVLEELMRRKDELHIASVVLLIRGRRKQTAKQRFDGQVAPSGCFAKLPLGWTRHVDVVEGDLSEERCGLNDLSWRRLRDTVTQVIHCAASVDFDLPVAQACTANITSSLNMLALAQEMPALTRFVSTSTAYVTPHKAGIIPEALAELPRPAEALLADIQAGVSETTLMAETGHANTYTYTKCIAEHMLVANRGSVPLTIVRPSIISASHKYPMPGWIDSKAAFAGFVVTIGSGLLRVVDANPEVKLDIVPVDHVAHMLVQQALVANKKANPQKDVPIVHAVAGLDHAAHIGTTSASIVRYFRQHRVSRKPHLAHLGARSPKYRVQEMLHHHLPGAALKTISRLRGDRIGSRRVGRIAQTLVTINRVFPYFTHHTFAFANTHPLPHDFHIDGYLNKVCRGAYVHLMRRDVSQSVIGGRNHGRGMGDIAWSLSRTHGSLPMRLAATAARSALRRLFETVSFDEPSFKRALQAVPQGSRLVIVPTHRSYVDYVVCAYLFFARPDLGVRLPRIAAADDFTQKPLWGRLFKSLRAQGLPRADTRSEHLKTMLKDDRPWQIFLEGQRSRGRHVLPPRTDILRAMQQTGANFALLPVGISYERIAEETPFLRERNEGGARPLSWSQLLHWARRAVTGRIHLGRVHLRADDPVMLTPTAPLQHVAQQLAIALRRSTVSTDYHLRAFVRRHPKAHIDVPVLRGAILSRGGQVLRSGLTEAKIGQLDAALEVCMRQHWQHLFAMDLLARYPDCRALAHALGESQGAVVQAANVPTTHNEPHLHGLLAALAAPVSADYIRVLTALQHMPSDNEKAQATAEILAGLPLHDRSVGPWAIALAQSEGLIETTQDGAQVRRSLAGAEKWATLLARCALAPARVHEARRAPAKRRAR